MAPSNPLSPIPQPPKMPVFGNMFSVDAKAPIQSLMSLAKELGPIFWLDMRGAPIVFVSGFSLVDELSDEKRFDKAVRGALRRVRAIAGDGLFTAETAEPNWAKAHHILLPPFGGQAMRAYHPTMVDIADQLVLKWERMNEDEEIDVVHDMTALTLDTIGLCGFDYRFNSFYRRDYHPFVEALVRSLETVMMTRGLPLEGLTMQRRRRDMAKDIAFLNSMVDDIVSARRAEATATAGKKDMLAAMLTGVDRVTREQLDDVNIRYQINTFLIAGHETTSGLLSYTIYALLKHPDVLDKAYEEVDRVFGRDLAVKPTYAQVTQLSYVTQILKEALRLWPPAPVFTLTPLEDETIGGKYRLKKRTIVNILVGALHRDASVWGANAEAFDPENFSRENEAKRPANAWKPFGNGQRSCIGRAFAMHEAALAIGMILQRFRLIDHRRYQLALKETLTVKPDGFKIKARLRDDRPATLRAPAAAQAAEPALAPARVTARVRPGHNTPLLILFGSNLGKAEELARQVADIAQVNGFSTTLAPLDDFAGALPKSGGVLIFCASYNGAPPDNAARFVDWLDAEQPAEALAGARYAVFGCGNRDWTATYQAIPRRIDERLTALGARRVFERGEGDARGDMNADFERWFRALGPHAAKEFGIDAEFSREAAAEPLYQVDPVASRSLAAASAATDAAPVKIVANNELQNRTGPDPSTRSTRHIEVELSPQTTYGVGDHLSVLPRNDPSLVDAVARRFGYDASDVIRLTVPAGRRAPLPVGEPIAIGRLLADRVELQQVATRNHIQILAEHTRCPITKPKLLALSGEDAAAAERYRIEVLAPRKSVCDLLEEYRACELPFGVFLEMLPPLAPRYYSISSSPSLGASRCSVTVGVVAGPAFSGAGEFKGVCSNYLAGRRVGEFVYATVKQTKAGFRLPADPTTPIIMIGPGTGLAPFRGFLQERSALKAKGHALGPALLFFGCRRADQDFIYADELKAFASEGVVELHVAFSRANGARAYVQDLITAKGQAVFELIERGAVIFVCGDAAKMEPGVKRALVDLKRRYSGVDEAAAEQWIEELGRQNRYVLDVWAGG
jgi:cytochrome P450 / NADPH-cytochrome P450 reductase